MAKMVLMNILDKFVSNIPEEIWAASCEVAKCNNLELLDALATDIEAIENTTKGIDLAGGLCPNSYHLEFALKSYDSCDKERVVFVRYTLSTCFLTLLMKKRTAVLR